MNKFELNQQNILVHIYYVNIRHVDLKTLEVLNAGNMQRHLAVRPERKEAKSKQLVQFSSGKTVFSPVLMGLGFHQEESLEDFTSTDQLAPNFA